jgi:nucleoside-diphosphate-sugar epimerase
MRALVTGAAGFIGSNLFNRLHSAGWSVTGVDDMSNGHAEFISAKDPRLMISDFSAPDVLDMIKRGEFDYVFHLAAVPRVAFSVERPFESNDINVSRTLRLLEACRGNIKRFIFSSSSAVYGEVDQLPTKEGSEKRFKSPYGLQKLIIENYLSLFYELYGLESISLRYSNVYGRNQLGDSPYSTAVSAWLTAIFTGRSLRSDGDGTQTRDMVHVDDVVDANIQSAIRIGKTGSAVLNIGRGESISNNEILDMLKSVFDKLDIVNAPKRQGDVMHTLLDVSEAGRFIAYQPKIDFSVGLDDTIDWYRRKFGAQ